MSNGYNKYLEYQYRMSGDFYRQLFLAIQQADENNLAKLAKGFPEEVEAYKCWTRIGVQEFAERLDPEPLGSLYDAFIAEYDIEVSG